MASTPSTSDTGSSPSTSRVPGAPPRTSATAGDARQQQHRDAGAGAHVLRIADFQARDIGDEIARARLHHAMRLANRHARGKRPG